MLSERPIYCAGTSRALHFAEEFLHQQGLPVTQVPDWNTGHVLLDVPSFRPQCNLKGGGNLDTLLTTLPDGVTIWGGNLDHTALEHSKTIDLLQDEQYLCQNAAITADCALRIAGPLLPTAWNQTSVLIIGWGRIGKCLARLLRNQDCPVCVAARKETDRAALQSLCYDAMDITEAAKTPEKYRLIINTAPAEVLSEDAVARCPDTILMDLASRKGISGSNVIWARGLPGIHAPESSGKLIAQTMLRIIQEEWK